MTEEPMIVLDKVSKSYGPTVVLRDCTMSIKRGEVVVICGPSGSGKSTLIKCINGLEPYQSGSIKEPTPGRLISPADSSSVSPSLVPWRWTRRRCCSTSRPRRSIPK